MTTTRIKTGGRKKDTPNRSTKVIRDKFQTVLDSFDTDSIINDLNSLKPLDRLKMINSLSEYILPKYQRLIVSDDNEKNREQPLFPDFS